MKKLQPKIVAHAFLDMTDGLPFAEQNNVIDAFITFLSERGNTKLLRSLPSHVERAMQHRKGALPVVLLTPSGKDAEHAHELSSALEKALGKQVQIREHADASLIGGARVSVGDERWDFSLRTALDSASEHLSIVSFS